MYAIRSYYADTERASGVVLALGASPAGALHHAAANRVRRHELEAAVLRIERLQEPPLAVDHQLAEEEISYNFV